MKFIFCTIDSNSAAFVWSGVYGCAVFFPSSIGAFGPTTPTQSAPQDTLQRPTTLYGITKVSAELG